MTHIRFANSFVERCHAWHLVHKQYVKSGLVAPTKSQLLFSPRDLLPTTVTAVAEDAGQLNGTMSASLGPLGTLPSGEKFELDLRSFGVEGRIICELTKLAAEEHPDLSRDQIGPWLMGYLLCWCAATGIDDAICVVHPRHGLLWSRMFGWRPISDVRQCSHVNDNPGAMMHINLRALRDNTWPMSSRGERIIEACRMQSDFKIPPHRLTGTEIALLLLQYPAAMHASSDFERNLLAKYYPWAISFFQEYCERMGELWRPMRFRNDLKPSREIPHQFGSPRARNADGRKPHADLKFLIIDQDPYTERLLSGLLGKRHHHFVHTPDLRTAKREIRTTVFDIILIGEKFGGGESASFTEELRKWDRIRGTHTPIFSLNPDLGSSSHRRPTRTTWSFEYPEHAVLLHAIDVLASEPPAYDYSRFKQQLSAWSKKTGIAEPVLGEVKAA